MRDIEGIKIGSKIREARKKLDISQEELAKRLNVKRTYISSVENGTGGYSKNTLKKFAHALNIEDIRYFYDWEPDNENKVSDKKEDYKVTEITEDVLELAKLRTGNPSLWRVLYNIAQEILKEDPDDNKIIDWIFKIPRPDFKNKIIRWLLKDKM